MKFKKKKIKEQERKADMTIGIECHTNVRNLDIATTQRAREGLACTEASMDNTTYPPSSPSQEARESLVLKP